MLVLWRNTSLEAHVGRAFDWSSANVSVHLNDLSLDFALDVTMHELLEGTIYQIVTLSVVVSAAVAPAAAAALEISVEPFGRCVVLGPLVAVRSVISQVSFQSSNFFYC